ncbi:MAG: hypothetical protein QM489_01170 [Candidatus Izemoplasma sp.]
MEIKTNSKKYSIIHKICQFMYWFIPYDKCDLSMIYRRIFFIIVGGIYLISTVAYYFIINTWDVGVLFRHDSFQSAIAIIIIWAFIIVFCVISFCTALYCVIMPLCLIIDLTFFNKYPDFTPVFIQNWLDKIKCEKIEYINEEDKKSGN